MVALQTGGDLFLVVLVAPLMSSVWCPLTKAAFFS